MQNYKAIISFNPCPPGEVFVPDEVSTQQQEAGECVRVTTVGGEFYPVDNVSLVLAYSLVNSWWMAPIGIGIGVGVYLVKRRF